MSLKQASLTKSRSIQTALAKCRDLGPARSNLVPSRSSFVQITAETAALGDWTMVENISLCRGEIDFGAFFKCQMPA